jgi:Zn finger protein HypA/HybF involved in hydrogenase expression
MAAGREGADLMPLIQADVEIWCEECGHGLCALVRIEGNNIFIPRCPFCAGKGVKRDMDNLFEGMEQVDIEEGDQ